MLALFSAMIFNKDDVSKFEKLYKIYRNNIIGTLIFYGADPNDIEDLTEDVLIKLIDYLSKIHHQEINSKKTQNLIITITKNTLIDRKRKLNNQYKKMANMTTQSADDTTDIEFATTPSVEDLIIEMENYKEVVDILHGLPEIHKEILQLRIFHKLSQKETATLLGISENAVGQRLLKAKQKVATLLERRTRNE